MLVVENLERKGLLKRKKRKPFNQLERKKIYKE